MPLQVTLWTRLYAIYTLLVYIGHSWVLLPKFCKIMSANWLQTYVIKHNWFSSQCINKISWCCRFLQLLSYCFFHFSFQLQNNSLGLVSTLLFPIWLSVIENFLYYSTGSLWDRSTNDLHINISNGHSNFLDTRHLCNVQYNWLLFLLPEAPFRLILHIIILAFSLPNFRSFIFRFLGSSVFLRAWDW